LQLSTIGELGVLLCHYSFILYNYKSNTIEVGYNILKEAKYFVSLQTGVVTPEEYNVMVNCEELIGTTEYLTL
jgi:hypothetical protein